MYIPVIILEISEESEESIFNKQYFSHCSIEMSGFLFAFDLPSSGNMSHNSDLGMVPT